jgi:tetratricopeptide (TPR) repeat protein
MTETDVQLGTLEARGLIRLATLRPELEYLFRHALVQDAAYGSLLKQERRELHGRVGEALELLYPERRDELAPVLAMHFEQAGEIDKAIDYFASGAQHALRQNAIQEAYGAFGQAAALIAEEAADQGPIDEDELARRRRRRVEVELGRAEAGYSFRAPEEAFEALETILPEVEALGDPELALRVNLQIAMGRIMSGEAETSPPVARSLERLRQIGEEIGDPTVRAIAMSVVAVNQVFGGPVRTGVAALEEALPLMEGRDDSIGAAFARGALAIGYATLGQFDKAREAAARATALAEAKGDLIAQLDALIAESMVRSAAGDLDRAVPIAEECVQRAEETGASACMMVSSWILGDAFHRQGRFAEARDVLQRGTDVSLVVDRRFWRPTLEAWLGTTSMALGSETEAGWDEGLATALSISNRLGEAGIRSKRAEARMRLGDLDAAREDFRIATGILEEEGARPNLARVLETWGSGFRRAGAAEEGDPILRRAQALFRELGLSREADAIDTELALGSGELRLT